MVARLGPSLPRGGSAAGWQRSTVSALTGRTDSFVGDEGVPAGPAEGAVEASRRTEPPYAPTPLAPRDPFALVCSLLLVPLLVSGYMATTLLTKALGTTAGRWRGLWLAGFAVATGLVIDLITTYWLKGLPSDSFWIVWPILALIILTVSLLAAVLRRLVGPLGIFLTVIVVVQFGNPSSGGANGVPYLPAFWNAIGPFLPPATPTCYCGTRCISTEAASAYHSRSCSPT